MTLRTTPEELDQHIKFLGEQATRLRDLTARQSAPWAERNASRMERIAEVLGELRRDLQMTGMNGKRIG